MMAQIKAPIKSFTGLLFSLLFVGVLTWPLLTGVLNMDRGATAISLKTTPPVPNIRNLLDPAYYQAWIHYTDNCLAADRTLVGLKNWLDYNLFAMSDSESTYVGRDGWLFDRRSIDDFRKDGCSRKGRIRQLVRDLDAVARLAELSGRRLVFTVAPDKASIYPEYVGAVPPAPECRQSAYDLLLAENETNPITGFVRLDDRLRLAKRNSDLLYDPKAAYWNDHGASIAAGELMARIFQHDPADDDAGDDLMAERFSETREADDVQSPSAVVYAGPVLARLLPHMITRFSRLDAIAGTHLPSANHHEDLGEYETILVIVTEPQLSELRLDLDTLCPMLNADSAATGKEEIALKTVSAGKNISVDHEGGRLRIKSMGAGAFLNLPRLTGSDDQVLRFLVMDLHAPHADTLTWRLRDSSRPGGTRELRAGSNRLYLPLPRAPALHLQINVGGTAGIFGIDKLVVLSFNKRMQQPLKTPDPEPAAISEEVPETPSCAETAVTPAPPPAAEAEPGLKLNDFEAHRIFQRHGTACDITISGRYLGTARAIEAQVVRYDTTETVIPWTVVDGHPDNGIFMGVIKGVPQGGWYRLKVRMRARHDVRDTGRNPWAVGLLAGLIGQSNMKEWFFAGNDLVPDNMVSVYRNGGWGKPENLGNGAAAFANRLVEQLAVPVGLLDYAVNGSGLRREADWGAGYWADRSPGSIYSRFVHGVTATGGVLEYVIWMQGEADAARKIITENQYRSALHDFITRQVRHDIANGSRLDHLPFLVVGMPKRPVGKDGPHQAIRNALKAVTEEVEDCFSAAVSLDLQNQGRQHLTPRAYARLGRRTAQAVLHLSGKTGYHRGPSAVRAQRVSERMIDVHLIHRGGNDIEPRTGITGFSVVARDGSIVPLDRVARASPSTIRLHMSRSSAGALRVLYLYGAMPDSQNAVHDNSPMQLPLEPFDITVD